MGYTIPKIPIKPNKIVIPFDKVVEKILKSFCHKGFNQYRLNSKLMYDILIEAKKFS